MRRDYLSFQSFSWVIGGSIPGNKVPTDTAYVQLSRLEEFREKEKADWIRDKSVQEKYAAFIEKKLDIKIRNKKRDRVAREISKPLVDFGFADKNRFLTEAGKELLQAEAKYSAEESVADLLGISCAEAVYLKQLIKLSLKVNHHNIRPFLVVIQCLNELEYLTRREFTYLLPLVVSTDGCSDIVSMIKKGRRDEINLQDIIYTRLLEQTNYRKAQKKFVDGIVTEKLICSVGMNRQNRRFDKCYYPFYCELKEVFLKKKESITDLLTALNNLKEGHISLWSRYLFGDKTETEIKESGRGALVKSCTLFGCRDERALKIEFFKYLHVFKAMNILQDNYMFNKCYLSQCGVLKFSEEEVRFGFLAKYFFAEAGTALFAEAFTPYPYLTEAVKFKKISSALNVDVEKIFNSMRKDYDCKVESLADAEELAKKYDEAENT